MSKLDDLMYQSGMTAQGCWDEMDSYQQEAIMKLSQLIAKECMDIIVQNRKYASNTNGQPLSWPMCVCMKLIKLLR